MRTCRLIVGLAIAGVVLYALDALIFPIADAVNMPFLKYFCYIMNIVTIGAVVDKCWKTKQE